MTDLYLCTIKNDINILNEQIRILEDKYKNNLKKINQKLEDLKKDEDKIMKRIYVLDRCKNCSKFECEYNNCKNTSLSL